MLNPVLFEALKSKFGEVLIANEDQPAAIEIIPGTVNQWTIPETEDHGEQYRVNCPFCNDHNHHLYISYLTYTCPVIHGTQLQRGHLRAQCMRTRCLSKPVNRHEFEGLLSVLLLGIGDSSLVINTDEATTPAVKYETSDAITLEGLRTWVPDYQPLDTAPPEVIEYLACRTITAEDIVRNYIGWGPIKSPRTGNYLTNGNPWVLLPIIQNMKVAGMQARCLPQYLTGKTPKYYFHPACRKRTLLYQLDEARAAGIAVVCEGVFDALAVGSCGVATFGHTPSSMQQSLLTTVGNCVIWLPDTDVRPDLNPIEIARKQCAKWNVNNVFPLGAHVVVLPAKDAGSMQRDDVWRVIFEQVPDNVKEFIQKKGINEKTV